LATLFVRPHRLPKLGALVRPATLLKFHKALYGHRPVCQADFDVMPQRGTGCSLISGLVMQAEACRP
jgi:hypothetical protein